MNPIHPNHKPKSVRHLTKTLEDLDEEDDIWPEQLGRKYITVPHISKYLEDRLANSALPTNERRTRRLPRTSYSLPAKSSPIATSSQSASNLPSRRLKPFKNITTKQFLGDAAKDSLKPLKYEHSFPVVSPLDAQLTSRTKPGSMHKPVDQFKLIIISDSSDEGEEAGNQENDDSSEEEQSNGDLISSSGAGESSLLKSRDSSYYERGTDSDAETDENNYRGKKSHKGRGVSTWSNRLWVYESDDIENFIVDDEDEDAESEGLKEFNEIPTKTKLHKRMEKKKKEDSEKLVKLNQSPVGIRTRKLPSPRRKQSPLITEKARVRRIIIDTDEEEEVTVKRKKNENGPGSKRREISEKSNINGEEKAGFTPDSNNGENPRVRMAASRAAVFGHVSSSQIKDYYESDTGSIVRDLINTEKMNTFISSPKSKKISQYSPRKTRYSSDDDPDSQFRGQVLPETWENIPTPSTTQTTVGNTEKVILKSPHQPSKPLATTKTPITSPNSVAANKNYVDSTMPTSETKYKKPATPTQSRKRLSTLTRLFGAEAKEESQMAAPSQLRTPPVKTLIASSRTNSSPVDSKYSYVKQHFLEPQQIRTKKSTINFNKSISTTIDVTRELFIQRELLSDKDNHSSSSKENGAKTTVMSKSKLADNVATKPPSRSQGTKYSFPTVTPARASIPTPKVPSVQSTPLISMESSLLVSPLNSPILSASLSSQSPNLTQNIPSAQPPIREITSSSQSGEFSPTIQKKVKSNLFVDQSDSDDEPLSSKGQIQLTQPVQYQIHKGVLNSLNEPDNYDDDDDDNNNDDDDDNNAVNDDEEEDEDEDDDDDDNDTSDIEIIDYEEFKRGS